MKYNENYGSMKQIFARLDHAMERSITQSFQHVILR